MAIHFTQEEFLERKSKVIKKLKEQNLDGLLMFRQESMYWLTGYDTFGYVYFQCLILTSKGDLILLTRVPDLRQAQNTSIIKDIQKVIELLRERGNMAIILVEQYLDFAMALADDYIILERGRVVSAGDKHHLAGSEDVKRLLAI